MITYDKSRSAWNFKDVNEDEKEALMEMAQDIWAKSMAFAIAQQMMAEAEAAKSEDWKLEGNEEGFH